MDSNYLCIIDGDYKVYKTATRDADGSSSNSSNKIVHLVETYQENLNRINSDESFTLVQSKDGNELFANMLKSFGISSPSIEQGESNSAMAEKILSEFASATTTSGLFDRISHYTVNSTLAESPSYIAFIVADFDSDHDPVFARLEDVQFKLTNLASAVASSSAAAALASLSVSSFNFAQTIANCSQLSATRQQKRFLILGWPIVYHCIKAELSLISATEVERPLYCKLMSGCVLCFTGFRKENKPVVSTCIRLAHYMGASVRKEYNKKITHLIVKSTLSTKFKTAHNIGKVHLLTEDWIFESWKHRNEVDFNVNSEEFLKKFGIKALYSLSIAFYGFTPEEAAHMREVTIEHGGTPAIGTCDPECTHIVVDDQGIKRMPCLNGEEFGSSSGNSSTTPPRASASSTSNQQQQRNDASIYVDLKSPPLSSLVSAQPKAAVVRAEWFWASIQMCCRASEVLYEYNMNSASNPVTNNANVNIEPTPQGQKHDPPTKRMKLSRENLLADNTDNSPHMVSRHIDSPDTHHLSHHHAKKKSANNLITNLDYDSPLGNLNNTNKSINRLSTDRLLNGTTSRNNMSNNNLSTSASLLDATTDDAMSIDSPFESKRENSHGLLNSASSNGATGGNNSKKVNKRFQRIYELCETEKRFVTILHTIINVFKEPIELPGQAAGPILDATEVKEIFGNLPPIYETHCTIKDRLERLTNRMHNDESVSVGEIYLDNADALLKIYPPFLNFYEKTKEAIIACDRNKPRFHAFLKIAQSRPECGRQTLIELLIRPVQRLPSTLLLLDDILKDTPKTHRDHELLSRAISCLKELMTHINEDKRKTDNHMTMFNLVNDIDNCPPNLLSSHRNFLKKLYVIDLSNDLFKKGSQLALFLFSDCLEICKPKFKVNPARSSPTSNGSSQASKQRNGGSPPAKLYKHVALFPFNNITKVCDILQNNEETDLFGFLYRIPGEKDKFYYFKVMGGTGSGSGSNSGSGSSSGFASHISTMTLNQLPVTMAAASTASAAAAAANTSSCNNSNYISSSRSYTYSLAHTSTMTLGNVSMAAASSNATSLYTSTTNLNFLDDMPCQALLERKEFMKLLAQGICNVKCITEYTSTSTLSSPSSYSSSSNTNCIFDEFNANIRLIEAKMDQDMEEWHWNRVKFMIEREVDKRQLQIDTPKLVQHECKGRLTNHKRYKRKVTPLRKLNSKVAYTQTKISMLRTIKLLNERMVQHLNINDNILCMIEAKQLQIDLNESGNLRKLDAVKRVTRAFSFNDTPNRIRKTISSVFRSPFQSSSSNSHYGTHHPYQQTLGHQPSSRLASLASLQLTPTLTETKRKLMHTLKSTSRASSIANESTSTLNGHAAANLLRQQTCSTINVQNQYSSAMNGGMSGQMTCSSLLSLDACINEDRIMPPPGIAALSHMDHCKPVGGAKVKKSSSENEHDRERRLPDITNINLFGSTSGLKRQFS